MPSLSVLLPVYNAGSYLTETLDSLLSQTRPADQIVIINDGSTDQSLEILQQFQRKEPRIQLVCQENAGVSAARNRGLAICEGDFIAHMDADDICQPERFELQMDAMERGALDLCGSWLKTFGSKSRTVCYPANDADLKWNYLFLGRTLPHATVMMRRRAVESIRFPENLAFAEDFGFYLKALMSSPEIRLGNIQHPLYNYRIHSAQASQHLQSQNRSAIIWLFGEMLPKAGIQATPPQLQNHYRLWKQQTPLSFAQLRDYLPLMNELSTWLSLHTSSRHLAASHWAALAKRHRVLGKDARDLITQAAGACWPLSWRMAERLMAHIS